MERQEYRFVVAAADQATAGRGAQALADTLREAEGVLEADRRKTDPASMDLGAVVEIVANVGTTLTIAYQIVGWLRQRRGVTLTIERDKTTGSLKTAVEDIDRELAQQIVELVRRI